MLLLQFSDRNYELGGFRAQYNIRDCPFGCSSHGVCINFSCFCDSDYMGETCEYEICPKGCSQHGDCIKTGDKRHWGCSCAEGYAGEACDIALNGEEGKLTWKSMMPEVANFTNRLEHTIVYDEKSQCVYAFGGYTLNIVLNDVLRYCLKKSYWEEIQNSLPWPSGRHMHTMALYGDGFYIFGGLVENWSHSDELWFFNIISESWTLCAVNSSVKPIGLSGHSMTIVEDYIYIIGGKSDEGLYSPHLYRINASNPESWEIVLVTGGRSLTRLIHSHSAVYHEESQSIIVYGGTMARSARYTELSSRIFAFNVQNHYWTEIYNSQFIGGFVPRKRAHHIAVIVGNYMAVYGGKVHIHHQEEKCYDEGIYLYHLGCHQWVDHRLLHTNSSKGQY